METNYYMVVNIKTLEGFQSFGRFSISDNKEFAQHIFEQLEGSRFVNENNLLRLDFIEVENGRSVNHRLISCTLDQLSENFKTVTRETFKRLNLDPLMSRFPN